MGSRDWNVDIFGSFLLLTMAGISGELILLMPQALLGKSLRLKELPSEEM